MVDADQFAAAIQRAEAINVLAKAAQSNKKSCHAMNHRIQGVNDIILTAFERYQQSPESIQLSDKAFAAYYQLLERMREFVVEVSKRKGFSKLFYSLRFRDEYDMLMREFDICVLDLNLGIALRTSAQVETDRNALEEDMTELKVFRKELQNGIDTLGSQLVGIRQMIATNQPMDNLLQVVEIDFTEVVEIAPPETRIGKTFPVHKRAWHSQEVAEKPLGHFGSQDMLDMLKSEVAILKKLDRSNYIAKFLGITNRKNKISIIMEWLPNGDLASYLARDTLQWDQKIFIAVDIARGLQFLHEVGIIHKTLRAKNILLTRYNQAKITNFRQSRLESAQTRPMSDPYGFVRWLAPEKMSPTETRYGPECDIYSFGMLLFEIASNRIPYIQYDNRELPDIIVLKDQYEVVPEGTPLNFANIMTACWSHDPRLRPTVSQVLLILRDACHELPNGEENFGGLPASMKNPAPLFAMVPPSPMLDSAQLATPPHTPGGSGNGFLTPEIWKNPYVNQRQVEQNLRELQNNQRNANQQQPTQQQQQQQQQQAVVPSVSAQEQRQPSSSLNTHGLSPATNNTLMTPPNSNRVLNTQPAPPLHVPQGLSIHHNNNTQGGLQSPPVSNNRPSSVNVQPLHVQMSGLTLQQQQQLDAGQKPQHLVILNTIADLKEEMHQQAHNTGTTNVTVGFAESPTAETPKVAIAPPPLSPGAPPPLNKLTRPLNIRPRVLEKALDGDYHQQQPESPTTQGAPGALRAPTLSSPIIGPGTPVGQSPIQVPARTASVPLELLSMAQGLNLHENNERTRAWVVFKSHCEANNPEGIYWTAYYLFHGEGGQLQDRHQAFALFRRVTALDQDPGAEQLVQLRSNAHFYSAVCFMEGQGVPKNHAMGFGHMEKAADLGNAFAQFLVGDAYSRGTSVVRQDEQKRNHYWQLAARQREQRAIDRCKLHWIPF